MKCLILTVLFFYACKVQSQNQPPIARTSDDREIPMSWNYTPWVYGTTSTDPDGWIAKFRWDKISGPERGIIVSPNSGNTRLDSLEGGIYVFRLTVTDNKGDSGIDDVMITMINDLPPPIDTVPSDSTVTDSTGLLRVETITGTIEYLNSAGGFERTMGKLVREIWYSAEHQLEYYKIRSITTTSGKVIDRTKYYLFYDATQRQ